MVHLEIADVQDRVLWYVGQCLVPAQDLLIEDHVFVDSTNIPRRDAFPAPQGLPKLDCRYALVVHIFGQAEGIQQASLTHLGLKFLGKLAGAGKEKPVILFEVDLFAVPVPDHAAFLGPWKEVLLPAVVDSLDQALAHAVVGCGDPIALAENLTRHVEADEVLDVGPGPPIDRLIVVPCKDDLLAALGYLVEHGPLYGGQVLHLIDKHDAEHGRQFLGDENLEHVGEVVEVMSFLVGP